MEQTLTATDVANAVRNEYPDKTFTLGDRTFDVKDLAYDDYIEFVEMARPIILAVSGMLDVKMNETTGEASLDMNPFNVDLNEIMGICKTELPRLAWLCCRQSDPKISIIEVKRLAKRPQVMLLAVMQQIKHNDLIKDFVSFFPQMNQALAGLVPAEMLTKTTPSTT